MNEALVKKLRLQPEMKALVKKSPSDRYLKELDLESPFEK